MKTLVTIFITGTLLLIVGCKETNYSLIHTISNESSRTLTFRFAAGDPDLVDTLFVIAPMEIDTLIAYTDLGEIVPAPNCGLGSSGTVTVTGGGTLTKDLTDPNNWDSQIDQDEALSSCTFVIQDEDIQ